jgi:3-deoxy-D-manno-octulosonate 8-phosphate phosphatase KdsC-like HAD superfamily phosphatase
VAVANALPALKEQADYITHADHGAGVTELIEQLLADDLQRLDQHSGSDPLSPGTR